MLCRPMLGLTDVSSLMAILNGESMISQLAVMTGNTAMKVTNKNTSVVDFTAFSKGLQYRASSHMRSPQVNYYRYMTDYFCGVFVLPRVRCLR